MTHQEQDMPTPNLRVSIQSMVRDDLQAREILGTERYGTPLQAYNGRSAVRDAYEEALDLTCYLRQLLEELGGEHPPHPTCKETTTHTDLVEGRRAWVCGLGCPNVWSPRMTGTDRWVVGQLIEPETAESTSGLRVVVRCLLVAMLVVAGLLVAVAMASAGQPANRVHQGGTDTPGGVLPSPYGPPAPNRGQVPDPGLRPSPSPQVRPTR